MVFNRQKTLIFEVNGAPCPPFCLLLSPFFMTLSQCTGNSGIAELFLYRNITASVYWYFCLKEGEQVSEEVLSFYKSYSPIYDSPTFCITRRPSISTDSGDTLSMLQVVSILLWCHHFRHSSAKKKRIRCSVLYSYSLRSVPLARC